MIAHVVDRPNGAPNLKVNATPVCGKDMCDSCGDCLACYASDPCPDATHHRWIVYADLMPVRAAELEALHAASIPGAP